VAADLLDEHRDLHGTEPQTALLLRHLDRGPALLDHRLPEPVVDAAAGVDDGAYTRGVGEAVEQLARAVT